MFDPNNLDMSTVRLVIQLLSLLVGLLGWLTFGFASLIR